MRHWPTRSPPKASAFFSSSSYLLKKEMLEKKSEIDTCEIFFFFFVVGLQNTGDVASKVQSELFTGDNAIFSRLRERASKNLVPSRRGTPTAHVLNYSGAEQ